MLPPVSIVNGKQTNPYMQLGGLEGVADVLSTSISDASVGEALQKQGIEAEYEVTRDFTRSAPVLMIQVKAPTEDDASKAQDLLLKQVPELLVNLQAAAGVAPTSRVAATTITRDKRATVNRKNQIRLVLVAGVGGVAGTYLFTSLLDSVLSNRRRKKGATTPSRPPATGGPAEPRGQPPVPAAEPRIQRPVVADPRRQRPLPADPRGRHPVAAESSGRRPTAGESRDQRW